MPEIKKTVLGKWINRETEKQITEVWGAPRDNTQRIKALSKTAIAALDVILTNHQKEIIEYNLLLGHNQRMTAKFFAVAPSTICRTRKVALRKLKTVLSLSALALKYYEQIQNE